MRQRTVSLHGRIILDHSSSVPLHRQIYTWLRNAILHGQLQTGQKLPSTRTLASELGVSRNTASTVYEQLFAEGYIERKVGSGTTVAHSLSEVMGNTFDSSEKSSLSHSPESQLALSRLGRAIAQQMNTPSFMVHPRSDQTRAFRVGMPALDVFPYRLWAQLIARYARSSLPHMSDYQESAGYRPLREAIAAHIAVTRGVRCHADQIIVVSGAQTALDLTARLLLDPGDIALIEDPGYPGARSALQNAGAQLAPVPVNENGIEVSVGIASYPHARLVYVTPSHQMPLGMTMSLVQRLALLEWASRANAWILEDDYDSEYRFSARPLEALQGLDRANRVIYIGSFSKVLFPSLRLGYLVVPHELVDIFVAAQRFMNTHPPILEQMALADFLVEGHFARHIRRMRVLYAARKDALITALRSQCSDLLEVHGSEAGMHLVGWLPSHISDTLITDRGAKQGIEVVPVSAMSIQPTHRSGLVLGYAASSKQEIQAGVRILANILHQTSSEQRNSKL